MPSKTPSISHIFLFIAGMCSIHSVANAAAPRNLAECQQAYFSAVVVPVAQRETPTVQNQLKAWCTTQCVDEKINIYASQQNQPVTEALRTQLTPSYQQTCTALFTGASSSNVAATPAGTGTGAGTATLPECTWNLPSGQAPTVAQQSACQQAMARQIDEQRRAEQARLQQQQSGGQQPSTGQQQRAAIVPPLLNAVSRGLEGGNSGTNSGTNNASSGNTGSGSLNYANPYANPISGGSGGAQAVAPPTAPIPTTPQGAAADATAGRAAAGDQVQNLPEQLQGPGEAANTGFDREQAAAPPRTEITGSADSATQQINGEAQRIMGTLQSLCLDVPVPQADGSTITYAFKATYGAFDKFLGAGTGACGGGAAAASPSSPPPPANGAAQPANASGNSCPTPSGGAVSKFNQRRTCHCAPASESAEKWCVESESAKAYRTVMDMAGPVLMGLNAAARTCGGMNDVSKFVGAGLTAVNGVCIAKKLSCERKCAEVSQEFSQAYRGEFFPTQQSSFNTEYTAARTACQNAADRASCQAGVMTRYNAYRDAVAGANRIYESEGNPERRGTVPNMIAKCEAKQRNIIGMATNIGAILLAANNAKKCEKELAAQGAADNGGLANVTGAEYCSNEATQNSQFCKCQASPSTEGCGQVIAAGPPAENTPQDQRGVNLQNGRGPSAFAGAGGGGSGSSSGYRGYNAGADGVGSVQSNLGSINSAMGGGANGAAAGLPGLGAGGGSAADGKASDAKAAAKKEEDKNKWSFGSIASSIGGSLGFGGGSRNNNNDSSGLQADRKAMIERKLASDRIAAEISPSTGADNFSKVKRSYVQKADTFMAP